MKSANLYLNKITNLGKEIRIIKKTSRNLERKKTIYFKAGKQLINVYIQVNNKSSMNKNF